MRHCAFITAWLHTQVAFNVSLLLLDSSTYTNQINDVFNRCNTYTHTYITVS